MDFAEVFTEGQKWHKDQLITFWPEIQNDIVWGYNLPWWRSVLCECFLVYFFAFNCALNYAIILFFTLWPWPLIALCLTLHDLVRWTWMENRWGWYAAGTRGATSTSGTGRGVMSRVIDWGKAHKQQIPWRYIWYILFASKYFSGGFSQTKILIYIIEMSCQLKRNLYETVCRQMQTNYLLESLCIKAPHWALYHLWFQNTYEL